jgi:hypothetical protein
MPSSTSSTPCVQLRIIRDNANSLKDEIFTINKGRHNDWRINHRSAFSQSTTTMFLSNRTDVLEYLHNILTLLKVDDERFHFLQFDIPCYPVVMVSRTDVLVGSQTYTSLVQVVESVLYNWPYDVEQWSADE